MNNDSIRHKLRKYQGKMSAENNQYRRALYAEKVGYYNNMLQSGGNCDDKKGLAGVVCKGTDLLGTEVTALIKSIGEKKNAKLNDGAIAGIKTAIESMKTNLAGFTDQITVAAVEFAKYNASVRGKIREITTGVNEITPLNDTDAGIINDVAKELASANINEIEFNQDLIGLLGVLDGDKNPTSITDTLDKIKNHLANKGANKFGTPTVVYAGEVRERKQADANVVATLDKIKN